jgi:hypothetical protein
MESRDNAYIGELKNYRWQLQNGKWKVNVSTVPKRLDAGHGISHKSHLKH